MTRLLCAMLTLAMTSDLTAGRAETPKFDASKVRPLLDKDQSLRSKDDPPRLNLSWVDKLKSHVQRCWRVPAGLGNAAGLEVRIAFGLSRDGTLVQDPVVTTISLAHPMGAAVAKSVVDAIKLCQPYSFLPAEQYTNGWDKLDMTFTITPAVATEPVQDGPIWLRDSAKQELRKRQANPNNANKACDTSFP